MDTKAITDALATKFDEMQKTVEESTQAQIKGIGVSEILQKQERIDQELDKTEAKLQTEVEDRKKADAKIEDLETKLADFRATLERDGAGVDEAKAEDIRAEAVEKYLRKGDERTGHFSEDEYKSLSRDSDPDGGYRLIAGTQAMITNYLFETSDVRAYANIVNVSTDHFPAIITNGGSACGWVGEKQMRGITDTARFMQKKIFVNEMYAMPMVTNLMLEDADFDVEAWLATEVSDSFSRTEAVSFLNGDNIEKPRGFLTYPDGIATVDAPLDKIQRVASGDANLLTADAFYEIEGELKAPYLKNSNWFFNRKSLASIRKLKDGDGNALWSPGFDGKAGSTILGYNYARFEDMPSVSAGALALAFGDLKQTYQIVDRSGVTVLRDPLTNKGQVMFYTTKRVGGDVKNFESLKLMEIKA